MTNEYLFNKLKSYKTISFDMFDTLVTRCVYSPDDIIKLVSESFSLKFGYPKKWYYKKFIKFSKKINKNNSLSDGKFVDILSAIKKNNSLSDKQLLFLKNKQLQLEQNFIIPRKDMLSLFNRLKKANKTILIVSDMFYSSLFLKKILNKCGFHGFKKIIVSCEVGYSKLNGKIWSKIKKEYNFNSFVHVGDNPLIDKKSIEKNGGSAFIISNPKTQFKKSYLFWKPTNLTESILIGLISNKILFNSPFIDGNEINNCYNLGYSIYGLFMLFFFNWIQKNFQNYKLLFISREGYYLQKIYKHFIKCNKSLSESKNCYFLASRQSSFLFNLNSWNDIKSYCKFLTYKGDIRDFFVQRFYINLNKKDYLNKKATRKNILSIAKKYKKIILKNSYTDRENYLKYLKKQIDKKSCIVDVGYKGTIVKNLSNLTKYRLSGAFMLSTYKNKKGAPKIFSPFPYAQLNKNKYVGVILNLFETFLSAPFGQFIKFDQNGNAVYKNDCYSNESFKERNITCGGIYDFIADASNLINITKFDISNKIPYILLNKFNSWSNKNGVSNNIVKLYSWNDYVQGIKLKSIYKTNK